MADDVATVADPGPVRERQWPRLLLVAVALVLLAVGVTWFVVDNQSEETRADTAEVVADSAQAQTDQIVAKAEPVCSRPQTDPAAMRLCAEIADAKTSEPTPAEQVDYARVQRIVADALEADPTLTEAALVARVQQVYKAHPPKNGKDGKDAVPPSLEELLTLIRQVYAENPPADGTNGQNAHCFDQPDDPACQPKQGVQGISVIGMRFERTDAGDCVLAELLRNPANGEDSVVRVPVPAQLCGTDEPPPTTEPEPTATEAPGGGLLPGG